MPTYEYECRNCKHRFDRFQSISAEPVKVCPECGAPVERLVSGGGGFIFKGSGFHATDYRRVRSNCGAERPCCGRESACDRKPCEH
jgi:putative FmdB family regulatory protein